MRTEQMFPFTVIKVGGGVLKNLTLVILMILIKRIQSLTAKGTIPFIIVSAFKGVTNELDKAYKLAAKGEVNSATEKMEEIFRYHMSIINDLRMIGQNKAACKAGIKKYRLEAMELLRFFTPADYIGGALRSDSSESVRAGLLAIGEKLSALILTNAFMSHNFNVYSIPASHFMVGSTDERIPNYTNAAIDTDEMTVRLRGLAEVYIFSSGYAVGVGAPVIPMSHIASRIALTPGFIGVDENNDTVNFGREGSDTSAVHAAHALQQSKVYFLKDVEEDRPITAKLWSDIQDMEIETESHLIGQTAISAAIEFGLNGVIVDFTTGKQYPISC